MKLRRLLSLALALAGLWLVAFHAALFWQRIADATILQSGVLGRWLASALLVAGLVAFRKHLHGRRALVFWVMVALLHAAIPAEERILNPAENIAALIQLGLVVLPAGLVALGLFEAKARPSFVARLDRGSKPLRSFDPASLRAPRSPPPSDSSFH